MAPCSLRSGRKPLIFLLTCFSFATVVRWQWPWSTDRVQLAVASLAWHSNSYQQRAQRRDLAVDSSLHVLVVSPNEDLPAPQYQLGQVLLRLREVNAQHYALLADSTLLQVPAMLSLVKSFPAAYYGGMCSKLNASIYRFANAEFAPLRRGIFLSRVIVEGVLNHARRNHTSCAALFSHAVGPFPEIVLGHCVTEVLKVPCRTISHDPSGIGLTIPEHYVFHKRTTQIAAALMVCTASVFSPRVNVFMEALRKLPAEMRLVPYFLSDENSTAESNLVPAFVPGSNPKDAAQYRCGPFGVRNIWQRAPKADWLLHGGDDVVWNFEALAPLLSHFDPNLPLLLGHCTSHPLAKMFPYTVGGIAISRAAWKILIECPMLPCYLPSCVGFWEHVDWWIPRCLFERVALVPLCVPGMLWNYKQSLTAFPSEARPHPSISFEYAQNTSEFLPTLALLREETPI